jgi:hypothetical protein
MHITLLAGFICFIFLRFQDIDFQQKEITSLQSLRYIDGYVVPFNLPFMGTSVGGLSGLDYDSGNNVYYLISDDRSAFSPARFYKASIHFSENRIDSIHFLDVKSLLQSDGSVYPSYKQDPLHAPDPESIRYDAVADRLVWTSEGDRIIRQKDTILQNPSINRMDLTGRYIDSFPLPSNLIMQVSEKGPRQNGALEGLTFSKDYKTMFASMEEPLFEDGPRAEVKEGHALARIYEFDMASGKNVAQYAYPLEPVAHAAFPPGTFKINGISEILSIGKDQLLVVERSFSTGRLPCTIKVFLADISQAGNILSVASLQDALTVPQVTKKLVLNMDDLGIYIDNVEGITLGPTLSNGHRTLLFVADNNFNNFEKTQLLWFEIIP